MRNTLLLLCMGLLAFPASMLSQNYTYSLSEDSTLYQPLNAAVTLAPAHSWSNKSFGLHLPFRFNLCGAIADSLTIDNNGFINFESPLHLSLVAFNGYTANPDSANAYVSLISEQLEGAAGSRILKIQFSNLSENKLSASDYLSYQVWLYENGNKIEFHTGPNARATQQNAATSSPVLMGILDRSMSAASNGYLVTGGASAPSGQTVGTEGLQYLAATPSSGIIYRLTPAF